MVSYLETKDVFLLEEKIKQLDYPTPKELLKSLNGRYTKIEIGNVIDYLLSENRILLNKGRIVYIWNPFLVKRILSNKNLVIL
jgi:hypothetical protein